VSAGADIRLSAGNDMALISSRVTAGDEAYLVAGDRLDVLAAQDSDYSLYDMKKKGSWGSKQTKHDEVTKVVNVGSEVKGGGTVALVSGGDQRYQAARLESGEDLTLQSGGGINFEGVKDLDQENHSKSKSSLAWNSMSGKGNTDETFRQTQMAANRPGELQGLRRGTGTGPDQQSGTAGVAAARGHVGCMVLVDARAEHPCGSRGVREDHSADQRGSERAGRPSGAVRKGAEGAGMTPVQRLAGLSALILVLMAAAAGVTWQVQDWRMGKKLAEQAGLHKDDLAAISNAAAAQVSAEQGKRRAIEQQLATQDQQHTKELSDAQRNQAALRDRLATADVRLSVLLDAADSASGCDVPTTAGAVSVVHAARRAQLDPAHAQRIIAITDDGDSAVIALRACQAYVRAVAP